MGYKRKDPIIVPLLRLLAWGCDNWFVIGILLVLFAPLGPHVLINQRYGACIYFGGLASFESEPAADSGCPIIRFFD